MVSETGNISPLEFIKDFSSSEADLLLYWGLNLTSLKTETPSLLAFIASKNSGMSFFKYELNDSNSSVYSWLYKVTKEPYC